MPIAKSIDLVVISTGNPVLCGKYECSRLSESLEFNTQTLEALTQIFTIFQNDPIRRIFYARGPGSFTALKLTHIFLQTLHILKGIGLYSAESFYFNANAPIHAFGNQFFCKENGEIVLRRLEDAVCTPYSLPRILREEDFSPQTQPLYILPPI